MGTAQTVFEGVLWGGAGGDRVRMRHRKWRHRKWKGDNFLRFLPVFPAFLSGTPLDSRYEQWNCRKLRNIKLRRHVTPKGSIGRGGMRAWVTGSKRFLPIRESFDGKWRMSCAYILLIFHSLIIYHLLSSCVIDFLGQMALSCCNRSSVIGHGRLFIIGQG
jgi:hypothetical protein